MKSAFVVALGLMVATNLAGCGASCDAETMNTCVTDATTKSTEAMTANVADADALNKAMCDAAAAMMECWKPCCSEAGVTDASKAYIGTLSTYGCSDVADPCA